MIGMDKLTRNVLGIMPQECKYHLRVHVYTYIYRKREREKREEKNFKTMPENGDNLIIGLCHYLELLW